MHTPHPEEPPGNTELLDGALRAKAREDQLAHQLAETISHLRSADAPASVTLLPDGTTVGFEFDDGTLLVCEVKSAY